MVAGTNATETDESFHTAPIGPNLVPMNDFIRAFTKIGTRCELGRTGATPSARLITVRC